MFVSFNKVRDKLFLINILKNKGGWQMAIDKVRLKALLSDLKRLTNELESEIYSDLSSYTYDEIAKCRPLSLDDDDGYPD